MCFIGQRLSDNFVILQFFSHLHNTDIPVSIPTYFSKTASNYKLRFLSKLLSKIELAVLLYLEDPSENNTEAFWLESKNVDETPARGRWTWTRKNGHRCPRHGHGHGKFENRDTDMDIDT